MSGGDQSSSFTIHKTDRFIRGRGRHLVPELFTSLRNYDDIFLILQPPEAEVHEMPLMST